MSRARALPALIFGADIGPLGVLRALTARGVRCYVADDTTGLITRSRWYRSPGQLIAETSDSDALATYLRSLDIQRAVLMPCVDRWAIAVAGLPADIRGRFVACTSERAVVEGLIDKEQFGALVVRLGIPHPATVEISGPADLDRVSDERLMGGFLKPTDSQKHRRHFGTKGTFVRSREAAMRRLREAEAVGVDFVFQEWIPGGHSASILIDGLVDRDGVVRALTARRKVREFPRRLGTTSSSVGIALDSVEEAIGSVKALLEDISYRGFFNIEFKHDRRDGHFKIIEFNPRPCWYTGTIASAGVDLPWLGYLDAQRLPVPNAPSYPVGRHALYELGDAKAVAAAVRAGRRPEGALARTWLTGDRALFWWRDPMPAVGGFWRTMGRRIARRGGRSDSRLDHALSAMARPTFLHAPCRRPRR